MSFMCLFHPSILGRKAHLPGAKLLRIVERKREKNANFFSPTELVLEDNSVWEVFFEYAEKPLQWPLDTPAYWCARERDIPSPPLPIQLIWKS